MVAPSPWGGLTRIARPPAPLYERADITAALSDSSSTLAVGNLRSYGDVCLNSDGKLLSTLGLNKFINFDADTGIVQCESGVMLGDIQQLMVPRGWMLAVTPGTRYVTVGGAVANDVHGKNHHRMGSFGDHVLGLELIRSDGERICCGPNERSEWFRATVGGLGLTGVIATVTLQLRRVSGAHLRAEQQAFYSLEQFFELADESERDWEYTVAWVDCMSTNRRRGIFFRANHEPGDVDCDEPGGSALGMPFTPPISLVNKLSLRAFNAAYFAWHRRKTSARTQHYDPFFYPLDSVAHWNRMYGKRGFYQYQCQLPPDTRESALEAVLAAIAAAGLGSFLSVLKTFGQRRGAGMLSFPRPGVTLALDFPNQGEKTASLFAVLDQVIAEAGGCLYPAKDARMPAALFASGYPQWQQFTAYRDPGISSDMSRRLMGA